MTKAVARVIAVENKRRRPLGLELIEILDWDVKMLDEKMCELPQSRPPNVSRMDFVLTNLGELKKTTNWEFARNVEEMILSYYNPVDNTLLVPTPDSNRNNIVKLAANFRLHWDDNKHDTSGGVINRWKKGILEYLGFVDDPIKHRYLGYLDQLREYKEVHGHCYPPTQLTHSCAMTYFLQSIRGAGKKSYEKLPQEVKDGLEDIGWDRKKNPYSERSGIKALAYDKERIVELEEFYKKFGHAWVPHPNRSKGIDKLYFWTMDVRLRINEPGEGVIPLDEGIKERLAEIGFLTKTLGHYGVFRSEHRHYDLVDDEWKNMRFAPRWNGVDQSHANGDIRRPDRVMYQMAGGNERMIIDEYDEAGHADRPKESEQRKVYHQCTFYLQEHDFKDIHIVRVNGGFTPFPSKTQAKKHAEIIQEILKRPFPDKPTVTVHMLDFELDDRHVEAYQARIIPQSNKIERATKEAQWGSKPMYDAVLMHRTET